VFVIALVICYNLRFPTQEKLGESPVWGTWGSASAAEKGDVDLKAVPDVDTLRAAKTDRR
jgi:hypothetical protein